MELDLAAVNAELRDKAPAQIVDWALAHGQRPVVTTNFRPYEATILHACTQAMPSMTVIWCDSGYNTAATYGHAEQLIAQLDLQVALYVPRQSAAHRDVVMGGIPGVDDPKHDAFTEQVKLEPFKRAMGEHRSDLWFTNLRKGQTAFRDSLDIVTRGGDGVLKVSPFFYWSDGELDQYLAQHSLTSEDDYYDPTKVLENRECGLHTQ
ncbi:MAG: phosphoadenosine phosphosulfate reductase family protein [Cellvibrionales bacterium]|nr:phosphoadenosine phosphosulfate reductase family protein [Porticoccaceae bacterium]|tara:strand:- start:403 stop:1023 length:621 start_codon:yes stop_codon:yes gene_type:complete